MCFKNRRHKFSKKYHIGIEYKISHRSIKYPGRFCRVVGYTQRSVRVIFFNGKIVSMNPSFLRKGRRRTTLTSFLD